MPQMESDLTVAEHLRLDSAGEEMVLKDCVKIM
ncbi:MAG: hypothetical protein QOH96_4402 [Blastocatellia bacterium]|nr:hypothetical protein [Blastocatellia bacterium]